MRNTAKLALLLMVFGVGSVNAESYWFLGEAVVYRYERGILTDRYVPRPVEGVIQNNAPTPFEAGMIFKNQPPEVKIRKLTDELCRMEVSIQISPFYFRNSAGEI